MQTYASIEIIMQDEMLTISEAAKYLKVSKDTLRRWEKRKILLPHRSPTGRRYYDKSQLIYVYSQKPNLGRREISNAKIQQSETTPQISTVSLFKKNFSSDKLILILIFLVSFYIILLLYWLISPLFITTISPLP